MFKHQAFFMWLVVYKAVLYRLQTGYSLIPKYYGHAEIASLYFIIKMLYRQLLL